MVSVKIRTAAGGENGTVILDDEIFGIDPNQPVLHQVVTAQLAARRAGSHHTKTRAEARGGGAKPWRQKGTGRARQGSIRSPQWRGGGVAHGPKPRSYAQRTPKKMKRLALRSALSDRAADSKVVVVDGWGIDAPRTRDAVAALDSLGIEGRALVVLRAADATEWKSFRNLQQVHLCEIGELNAYDVLVADWIIFTTDTLPGDGEMSGRDLARRNTPPVVPKPDKPVEKQTDEPADEPAAEQTPTPVQKPAEKAAPVLVADESPVEEAPATEAPTAEAAGDEVPKKKVIKKVVKKVVKKKVVKKVVKKPTPVESGDTGKTDDGDDPDEGSDG